MADDYQYEVSDHLNNEISDHLEIQSPYPKGLYLIVMNIEKITFRYRKVHKFPSFIPVTLGLAWISPGPDLPLPSL